MIPLFLAAPVLLAFAALRTRSLMLTAMLASLGLHCWLAYNLKIPKFEFIYGEFIMRFYGLLALAAALGLAASLGALIRHRTAQAIVALIILAIPVYRAPRSLEAANNRNDLTIDFELEQILSELPKNSVFIATLDRIGMGLTFKQLVFRRRPDVAVLIGPMLGSSAYAKVLKTRFKSLHLQDSDSKLTIHSVLASALSAEKLVFAYREATPPEGYYHVPIGAIWQWLPNSVPAPDTEKVMANLFAFCASWPKGLGKLSEYRTHSRHIVRYVFIDPIVTFMSKRAPAHYRSLAKQALSKFQVGDAEGTKAICENAYRELTGQKSIHSRPYESF